MRPIGDAQVTFGQAARAAGITEKQLRNWLDKGQVLLIGDDKREQGQWRKFAIIDLIRIASVGRLVSYGVDVSTAYELVRTMVDTAGAPEITALASRLMTPKELKSMFRGRRMAVSRQPDGELSIRIADGLRHALDTADLTDFVFIDIGKIAASTLDRFLADGTADT
jgi:hypothetical protein